MNYIIIIIIIIVIIINNNKGQAHENPTSCFFITHNPFLAILMTLGVGECLS